jgi:hypothetical protein
LSELKIPDQYQTEAITVMQKRFRVPLMFNLQERVRSELVEIKIRL